MNAHLKLKLRRPKKISRKQTAEQYSSNILKQNAQLKLNSDSHIKQILRNHEKYRSQQPSKAANALANKATSRNTARGLTATNSWDKVELPNSAEAKGISDTRFAQLSKVKTKPLRYKSRTKAATIDFSDGQPLASHREPQLKQLVQNMLPSVQLSARGEAAINNNNILNRQQNKRKKDFKKLKLPSVVYV